MPPVADIPVLRHRHAGLSTALSGAGNGVVHSSTRQDKVWRHHLLFSMIDTKQSCSATAESAVDQQYTALSATFSHHFSNILVDLGLDLFHWLKVILISKPAPLSQSGLPSTWTVMLHSSSSFRQISPRAAGPPGSPTKSMLIDHIKKSLAPDETAKAEASATIRSSSD